MWPLHLFLQVPSACAPQRCRSHPQISPPTWGLDHALESQLSLNTGRCGRFKLARNVLSFPSLLMEDSQKATKSLESKPNFRNCFKRCCAATGVPWWWALHRLSPRVRRAYSDPGCCTCFGLLLHHPQIGYPTIFPHSSQR